MLSEKNGQVNMYGFNRFVHLSIRLFLDPNVSKSLALFLQFRKEILLQFQVIRRSQAQEEEEVVGRVGLA